ncbi:hypothetical protein LQ938_14605 [Microbacterium sp. cx-55]|uniref:hypothetical protein n=1 Tax=Microbacterium sp. cx-55 TaxID=2875948 RepID=UPI001CBF04CD|nr:hypothetical protein [Microbacterium sp. cx-55]MBZ4488425.1 hypothetical protein [Microbacterium sp. cx-55]UGB35075.1 hypothetical protein LQ938_14605 [Microbacterium sp. cx-55]
MSTFLLTVVLLVSVAAVAATVVAVARDGYRPVRTDRSRLPARAVEGRRTAAQIDADEEAAVRANTPTGTPLPAEGHSLPAEAAPRSAPTEAPSVEPALTSIPTEDAAHAAVRRGGRARGPRRAASAPKSPR